MSQNDKYTPEAKELLERIEDLKNRFAEMSKFAVMDKYLSGKQSYSLVFIRAYEAFKDCKAFIEATLPKQQGE